MSFSSSAVSSASKSEAASGVGHSVAVVVSYLVNPIVLPPLVYGFALAHVGAPARHVATGVGVATLFLCVVPLLHVSWMRMRGAIGSLEIRDRRRRTEPFLGVVGATLGALILAATVLNTQGQALLVALLGCHLLNTLLLLAITQWWKISVHCASVAGAVSTLAFVRGHVPGGVLTGGVTEPAVFGTGLLLVPLLLWARVRSRAHTWAQAAAGTVLGFVAPYLELYGWIHGMGL